jgi:CBS domain containing-hemolysin-like protein
VTPTFANVPLLADYAREIALSTVVMVITFASIVLGELLLKRIAMQHPVDRNRINRLMVAALPQQAAIVTKEITNP